jgi:hypothetical protein
MTEITEFEETLHKKGIYHFREMSLDKQYKDFLNKWTDFLYETSPSDKYNFHTWLTTYQHDTLFDYSNIDFSKYWYDDSEEHIERFKNFSDFIKQFLYKSRDWIDDNCCGYETINNDIKIEREHINIILKNYSELKKLLKYLGASNLPEYKIIENGFDDIRIINNKKECRTFIENSNEYCSHYEEFEQFFFVVPQMKNDISVYETYEENSSRYINTEKTVWFNQFIISITYSGYYDGCEYIIRTNMPGKFDDEVHKNSNNNYINFIKNIMTFYGLDTSDMKLVSTFNKYLIKCVSSDKHDITCFESVYLFFKF